MPRIDLTKIQREALGLLKSSAIYILLYGGSRSGKTRIIIEYIFRMCIKHSGMRVLIARQVYSHAISTLWKQTMLDVINTYRKKYGPEHGFFTLSQSSFEVKFRNGSTIYLAGLDDKERLEKMLGGEYAIIYLNECSQISYEAVTMAKTRLAQSITGFDNKMLFDENPPGPQHWTHKWFIEKIDPITLKQLKKPESVMCMLMNPLDNLDNLSEEYMNILESMPEKDRRRFLKGEFVGSEDALWTYEMFNYITDEVNIISDNYNVFERIVVALDPSGTSKSTSDACGIMVVGKYAGQDRWCILEDATKIMSPNEWARKAIALYHKYEANKIIYENNYGGDMVKTVIKAVDRFVPIDDVRASKGKMLRAEPIVALYEQHKVDHFDNLSELEYEMTTFNGDPKQKSPNRLDAAVWGITYLFGKRKAGIPNVRISI